MLHDCGRAEYVSQDDAAALDAVVRLARTEGILPALESAHAVAEALQIAPAMDARDILVVNLSGRGDKDMGILARELKMLIELEVQASCKMSWERLADFDKDSELATASR